MLLSVLGVFSTARQSSQTLKYTFKARNKAPAQQCFLDKNVQVKVIVLHPLS